MGTTVGQALAKTGGRVRAETGQDIDLSEEIEVYKREKLTRDRFEFKPRRAGMDPFRITTVWIDLPTKQDVETVEVEADQPEPMMEDVARPLPRVSRESSTSRSKAIQN